MTDPCTDNCGRTLLRTVYCVDVDPDTGAFRYVNEEFCTLPGSSAGEKPVSELKCAPCGEWKREDLGCQYASDHKSCRPGQAKLAWKWTCNAEHGCGPKPPDPIESDFEPCTKECLPLKTEYGPCENPAPYSDVVCEIGQARKSVKYICESSPDNPDVCELPPDVEFERCTIAKECLGWQRDQLHNGECRRVDDESKKVSCGTGYVYYTKTCPQPGMCDPLKRGEDYEPCKTLATCTWVTSGWDYAQ
jgi:hypothetical protein